MLLPFVVGWLAGGLHQAGAAGAPGAALAAVVVARTAGRSGRTAPAAAGAAGLALGALAAVLAAGPPARDDVAHLVGRGVVGVEGEIVRSEQQGARVALTVRAERVRSAHRTGAATGLVGVTVAHAAREWPVGARVRVVGTLRRPRSFGNPGGWDHAATLRRRGILATVFLWDETRMRRLDSRSDVAFGDVRGRLTARIAAATREPVRGYLTAVLLGATRSLDRDTRTTLSRTGLAHVVSVSGFHVAVAAGSCLVALRWLLVRSTALALRVDVTTLAAALGLGPVLAYAVVAGGTIPAVRAFLAYGVLVAALLAGRPPDGIRALAFTALVLAGPTPDVAADVSFQLSFVSVAGLLLLARRQREQRDAADRTPRATLARWCHTLIVTPAVVAAGITAATAPLTAWHFQQISLVAPLANVLALPLLGPATLLPGLAALPLLVVAPPLGDALLAVAGHAAALGLALATRLAAWPWAAVATPMPSFFEVALCQAALALGWWRPARARMRRRLLVALVVLAGLDVAYWTWERHANPTLRITFLDVGQGDAAVVELPRGGVLVVDGGGLPGDFDPGERLVAPFLRARKIATVDVLALSHPQLDHYGGLAHLATHFAPRELWWNGMRATSAAFARLEAALAAAGARRATLVRGMAFAFGAVEVRVLHPERRHGLGVNDASLVLQLRYGRTAVLFTGDVERGGERALLARVGAGLASDVLKVPHHGSATSSTASWIAAVRPRIAVVSSGHDNRFGFPAPAVVQRLRAAGAAVWSTSRHGAVRVVSDGRHVAVSSARMGVDGRRFEFPKSLW